LKNTQSQSQEALDSIMSTRKTDHSFRGQKPEEAQQSSVSQNLTSLQDSAQQRLDPKLEQMPLSAMNFVER